MPGNGVTERSRQLRHCQTERTGDCRLQHETDRGCVFDSASQKQLSEAQSKALSARFNTALEASLQAWAAETPRGHSGVACCGTGGTGYHPEIQQETRKRFTINAKGRNHEMPGLIALLIWGQSVAAADLGTWGDLWPVKEPDMLTVIMQRLTALEQSGEMGRKMDAFKERVIRNSLRPLPCPVSDARRNTAAGCLTRPSDWLRISG